MKQSKSYISVIFLIILSLSILYMLLPGPYFMFLLLILYIVLPLFYAVHFFICFKKRSNPTYLHVGVTSLSISLLFLSFLLLSSFLHDSNLYPSQLLYVQLTVLFIFALNLLFAPNILRSSFPKSMVFSFIVVVATLYTIITLNNVSILSISSQSVELSRNYIVSLEVIAFLLLFSLVRLSLYKGSILAAARAKCIFITILLLFIISMTFFFQSSFLEIYPLQFALIFAALGCIFNFLSHTNLSMDQAVNAPVSDENEQRILTFFENIPLGFGLFQCNLNEEKKIQSVTILKVNAAAAKIFSQPKNFVEKNELKNVLPTIDHLLIQKCNRVFSNPATNSFRFTHPAWGETYQIFAFPLDNNILGTIFTNITHEYALENEYFDFINTTSHELRNPILAIQESFYLLMNSWNTERTEPQLHLQNIFFSNISKIKNLVEQVLDYQKYTLQDGKEKSLQQINDIVSEVHSCLLPVAYANDLKMSFTPDKKLPMIMVYKDGIETIVTNLVNNAIKYSTKGTIQVSTQITEHNVIIQVKDEGIGIYPQDIQSIFEPYTRIRTEKNKTINGSGLGLSIVKKIIFEHQGTILVESIPNEGSTFTVHLPIA